MIIRRRVLLEAGETKPPVDLSKLAKWDLKMIEEKFNNANTEDRERILDEAVLHFVYKDNKTNNYNKFVQLDYAKVKYPWIQAMGFEIFNKKLFPFFAFMQNDKAIDIISNDNDAFLKAYNYILANKNLTFTKLHNSNAEHTNIIFIKDLYSKQDYIAIADLYYNTNYTETWKINLDKIFSTRSTVENNLEVLLTALKGTLGGLRSFTNISLEDMEKNNNKLKFKNTIFYEITSYDRFGTKSKVRNLNSIKSILEALDKNIKFDNASDTAKKALKNVTKKEDIEAFAKNFTKEQAQIAIPILQQTING